MLLKVITLDDAEGTRTSMILEEEFWEALEMIAKRRGITVNQLISRVDQEEPKAAALNRTRAVRVFVVRQMSQMLGNEFSSPTLSSPATIERGPMATQPTKIRAIRGELPAWAKVKGIIHDFPPPHRVEFVQHLLLRLKETVPALKKSAATIETLRADSAKPKRPKAAAAPATTKAKPKKAPARGSRQVAAKPTRTAARRPNRQATPVQSTVDEQAGVDVAA